MRRTRTADIPPRLAKTLTAFSEFVLRVLKPKVELRPYRSPVRVRQDVSTTCETVGASQMSEYMLEGVLKKSNG